MAVAVIVNLRRQLVPSEASKGVNIVGPRYLLPTIAQKFVSAVTQHESGIPGNYPGKAKRGFTRLARNGTQLEFPQFEQVRAVFLYGLPFFCMLC